MAYRIMLADGRFDPVEFKTLAEAKAFAQEYGHTRIHKGGKNGRDYVLSGSKWAMLIDGKVWVSKTEYKRRQMAYREVIDLEDGETFDDWLEIYIGELEADGMVRKIGNRTLICDC